MGNGGLCMVGKSGAGVLRTSPPEEGSAKGGAYTLWGFEKELPDEQQLRKEQKRLNKKELQDEKGPLNRELFKGRRSLEPVGSRTDTVARGKRGSSGWIKLY